MFCVEVAEVKKHSEKIATISFKQSLRSFPGQFIMLNVFDHEEVPLSLSSPNSVTVKAVGETTNALINYKKKILGIRGPFGRPFKLVKNKRVLIIAGGIGVAPLKFLYDSLKNYNEIKFVYGAKSRDEIVFQFENCLYTTEDGSLGMKGTVVDALKKIDLNFDFVYCCGKEEMIRAVWKVISSYIDLENFQFSLERYMRCGFGVCGSCSLENGLLVCRDGPVFNASEVKFLIL
ncbi:MAG: dihydroorotate dehydrogenase electron transfer subunit [Archaeoglobaceae archaeon]|nr:dihydroorotate dehydrogenase electron transfer subunit [Archaeoglobaceae archaeon]MCX8151740.1 dihydroorotate dehydrogenase electron transfer subunit [Archaeoglobaceae archaeon]MDW8014290.1 dihydroorotate dehydrogenase electron transfer subunit [Archaeoglobaceae archaeon]